MTPLLNSRQITPWLPWLLLLGICALLQVTNLYPSLRLELRPPQWSWVYSIFTNHFVHLNSHHWLLNSLALMILASVFAPYFSWRAWLLCLLVSAFCVSAGLLLWPSRWHSYAGLSGVLHGLYAMGCLLLYRQHPRLALGLAMLLLVKLGVEHWYGPLSETSLDFPAAGTAHVYGAIGGILSWSSCYILRSR